MCGHWNPCRDGPGLWGLQSTGASNRFLSMIYEIDIDNSRFEAWLKSARKERIEAWVRDVMPPLDVLMVWHAYLLNPTWYAEDTQRIPLLRKLHKIGRAHV